MYKKGIIVQVIEDHKYKTFSDVQLTKGKNYIVHDNLNSKTISSSHPIIIFDDFGNKVQLKYTDVISIEEIRAKKLKNLLK